MAIVGLPKSEDMSNKVHQNFFGQWPEMPWKRERSKMQKIEALCPRCESLNRFSEIKGYTISPIVCVNCHALLAIRFTLGEWVLEVIDIPDEE